MKYSFISFSTPDLTLEQTIEVAKKYGYEGFEARTASSHKHGIEISTPNEELEEKRLLLQKSGIKLCCIATGCSFANPETCDENIETAKKSIDLANKMGATAIRVFGGLIPEGITREKSYELIVAALKSLSDFAQEKNVKVCVEPHDHWCDAKLVADIMSDVNHPNIVVNWDIMHPVISAGYTMEESFEILKPWIFHVHIHDGERTEKGLKFLPIGEGNVDHKTALNLLKKSGYQGFLSGEWIGWEPYDIHLPREINTMKSYE